MIKLPILMSLLVYANFSIAQDNLKLLADKITSRAILIYELEKSAWIAGDLVSVIDDTHVSSIESYISYKIESEVHCIFYSKMDTVLFEYVFQDLDKQPDLLRVLRPADATEQQLIAIKRSVKQKLLDKKLKKVKVEKNTTYNFVPMIIDSMSCCYLINAISDNTQTILGRDHLITLDDDLNVKSIKGNHKSIQYIRFDAEAQSFFHTHVISDTFFETELATLMLYKPYLKSTEFMVVSNKYTSHWDNTNNTLTIK